MTITEFIEANTITMTTTAIPCRPDQAATKWDKTAKHWKCTLTRTMDAADWKWEYANLERFTPDPYAYETWVSVGDPEMQNDDTHARSLIVYFSQGSAHTEPPTVAEVLDCYRSDAASGTADTFEDFMADLYSADERFTIAEITTHQATYAACQLADTRLARWLTNPKYNQLTECEYE